MDVCAASLSMETGREEDRHRWEPRLIRGLTNTAKVRGGSGGDGEGRTRGMWGQQEISFQAGCPSGGPNTSPILGTASERHSGPLRRDLKKEACRGVLPPGPQMHLAASCGCVFWMGHHAPSPGSPFQTGWALCHSATKPHGARGVGTGFSSFPMKEDRAHGTRPM